MDIEKDIVCPVCGGEIEWDDTYDHEMDSENYICHCVGTCVKCKENIEYDIIYQLCNKKTIIIDHYR